MKLTDRRWLLTLLLCFPALPSHADIWDNHERIVVYPSVGLVYQRELMAEISFVRVNNDLFSSSGYRLGAETNFNGNHLIVAPRAAAELCFIFGIIRLGAADYWQTNIGKHDFRFTPEIGLTYPNIATLTFGYNFHLFGFRNGYVGGPKLSLMFCFDRKKIKNLAGGRQEGMYY